MLYRRGASAWNVVEDFEIALAEYTGAREVVVVDSCSNALFLSCLFAASVLGKPLPAVDVPRQTYVGVPHAVRNAGFEVEFTGNPWRRWYRLSPLPVVDAAKLFERGMFELFAGELVCVSFHVGKRLPLGRGGAILTDDDGAAEWLRRARFDGRTAGESGERASRVTSPGWHMYLTPPEAARGLWLLEQFVDAPAADDWTHYPDVSELM